MGHDADTRDEAELLRAAADDAAAFARFYRRHVDGVIAFFHRRRRRPRPEPEAQRQAVLVRKVTVDDHDVRGRPLVRQPDLVRLAGGRGRADACESRLEAEQGLETATHGGMVVDDKDAGGGGHHARQRADGRPVRP